MTDRIRHCFWPDHRRFNYSDTIDAGVFTGKYDNRLWENSIKSEFEKEKFVIPEQYDRILRIIYGDYMQLPPEEKRGNSHMYEAYLHIDKEVAEEVGIDL